MVDYWITLKCQNRQLLQSYLDGNLCHFFRLIQINLFFSFLFFSRRASKRVSRCSSSGHLNLSLMHLSEFLRESMQTQGHAGVFLYFRGGFLEAPLQKLPEDMFTTVRERCWGKTENGGVAREISLKFMCPYRAAESQGVPVTHCGSLADSLSACWALHAPVSVTAAFAITCCWSSPRTRPNWTVMDSRVLGGWVGCKIS